MFKEIVLELKTHAPFTMLGCVMGVGLVVLFMYAGVPRRVSLGLFKAFHPLHIFLSAMTTAGMYRLNARRSILATAVVGYVGAVGAGTLSDCLIPFAGEWLVGLPNAHAHIGFIKEWYLVNPLALLGVAAACWRPVTKFPHAGHVLLSTWASLLHISMAFADGVCPDAWGFVVLTVFLFLAVWVPCCTSDIAFPLLLAGEGTQRGHHGGDAC